MIGVPLFLFAKTHLLAGPGWGEPPTSLENTINDLNVHLGPAGLSIKLSDINGQNTGAKNMCLYTLVNTRTDEMAAKTARWELWEHKTLVQLYHTLRKPYV